VNEWIVECVGKDLVNLHSAGTNPTWNDKFRLIPIWWKAFASSTRPTAWPRWQKLGVI